jgi:hypothetical protein
MVLSGGSGGGGGSLWTQSGSDIYYNTGNVGIGTATPASFKLQVAGHLGPNADGLYDLGAAAVEWRNLYIDGTAYMDTAYIDAYLYHYGDTNTMLYFTSDRLRTYIGSEYLLDLYEGAQDYVKLGDGGDVDINLNDNMFVNGSDGNVGIGTTNPSQKLDVAGAIQLGTTAAAEEGVIRYTSNRFEGYNGTDWTVLSGGSVSGGGGGGIIVGDRITVATVSTTVNAGQTNTDVPATQATTAGEFVAVFDWTGGDLDQSARGEGYTDSAATPTTIMGYADVDWIYNQIRWASYSFIVEKDDYYMARWVGVSGNNAPVTRTYYWIPFESAGASGGSNMINISCSYQWLPHGGNWQEHTWTSGDCGSPPKLPSEYANCVRAVSGSDWTYSGQQRLIYCNIDKIRMFQPAGNALGRCDYLCWDDAGGSGGSLWTQSGFDIYYNNTGNVGIGTTSPGTKLDISDSGFPTMQITSSSTIATAVDIDDTSAGGREWRLQSTGSATGRAGQFEIADMDAVGTPSRIAIDTTGNVGIGTTSPGAKLEVRGDTVQFASSADDTHTWLPYTDGEVYITGDRDGTGNGDIHLRSWGDTGSYEDKMIVEGDTGNVGIGTTSPQYLLHVDGGDVRLTNNLIVDQQVTGNAEEILVRKAACLALIPTRRFGGLFDVHSGLTCAQTCLAHGDNDPICHRPFSTSVGGYVHDCNNIHAGYPPVYCCCSYDGSAGRTPDYPW